MEFKGASEAAEIIGVNAATIRRWCEAGKIAGAAKLGPRAWAIPTAEVERLRVLYEKKREDRG